jgi:hypothetical protein
MFTFCLPSPFLDQHCRMHRAVYIPTQLINFALIPPQFRFVFVSVVSLGWSASSISFENATLTPLIVIDTYLSIVHARLGTDIVEPVGY